MKDDAELITWIELYTNLLYKLKHKDSMIDKVHLQITNNFLRFSFDIDEDGCKWVWKTKVKLTQ